MGKCVQMINLLIYHGEMCTKMINLLIIITAWWVSDWDIRQTDTDKEVPTPGGEKTNNMGRQHWDLLLETWEKYQTWSSLGSNSGPTPNVIIWHCVCVYMVVFMYVYTYINF